MGRPLNSNPIEYVSDEVEVLNARIAELEAENAALRHQIENPEKPPPGTVPPLGESRRLTVGGEDGEA